MIWFHLINYRMSYSLPLILYYNIFLTSYDNLCNKELLYSSAPLNLSCFTKNRSHFIYVVNLMEFNFSEYIINLYYLCCTYFHLRYRCFLFALCLGLHNIGLKINLFKNNYLIQLTFEQEKPIYILCIWIIYENYYFFYSENKTNYSICRCYAYMV